MVEFMQVSLYLAVACVTALMVRKVMNQDVLKDFPTCDTALGSLSKQREMFLNGGAHKLYLKGYQQFKEKAWQITTATSTPSIVVPLQFIPELRDLPDDVLSFDGAVEEMMHSKYTKAKSNVDMLPYVIKTSLTPSLPRLHPILAEEVHLAIRSQLPQSPDWQEVKVTHNLLRVIAAVSGRVFVGSELCRDEKYLDIVINFSKDMMSAIHAVSRLSPWIRWLAASRLPEVKKVHERINTADSFLRPVIASRREAATEIGYSRPHDLLQWIIDSQERFGPRDGRTLARYQLGISFASIHNTTATTVNALYTLAAMPEIISILREDVLSSLRESDGHFNVTAMQNMQKLDSFLRESMRYYPLSATSFHRKVLRSFTLSNGQVMPTGMLIELPAIGIYNDDALFPDHDKFDALRFWKLRQANGNCDSKIEKTASAQAVCVRPTNLTFGYGRHACPGRFFAVSEIKILLAVILVNYDIKLREGSGERHQNLIFGSTSQPDPDGVLLMRQL